MQKDKGDFDMTEENRLAQWTYDFLVANPEAPIKARLIVDIATQGDTPIPHYLDNIWQPVLYLFDGDLDKFTNAYVDFMALNLYRKAGLIAEI